MWSIFFRLKKKKTERRDGVIASRDVRPSGQPDGVPGGAASRPGPAPGTVLRGFPQAAAGPARRPPGLLRGLHRARQEVALEGQNLGARLQPARHAQPGLQGSVLQFGSEPVRAGGSSTGPGPAEKGLVLPREPVGVPGAQGAGSGLPVRLQPDSVVVSGESAGGRAGGAGGASVRFANHARRLAGSLVADAVVFNSAFNMDSFLSSVPSFLNKIPDRRPPHDLVRVIRPKCRVLYFPLCLADVGRLLPESQLPRSVAPAAHAEDVTAAGAAAAAAAQPDAKPLHIVWPHRWEHDKDPELFFSTVLKLKEEGLDFLVSVLGEAFTDVPEVFARCRPLLDSRVLHWGFLESRERYLSVLRQADVVLSTARHEFFGVAVLEAVHCGCYPLCPKALVYPEIFPAEYLYATPQQLLKRLRSFCGQPSRVRTHTVKVDTSRFSWDVLKGDFQSLLSP